ncbi:MAG: putative Ig domain-containing protein [Thermoplasmatota archaeon]
MRMKRYTKTACSALLTMAIITSSLIMIMGGIDAKDDTRASTLYVGADQTYKTIKAAVNAASSGDTIRIYAGIYHEPLTISKSLTFQGNGSKTTIVNQTTNEVTWWITASGVTIKDIGFEANRSIMSWAIRTNGFNTSGGSFITIQRCSFKASHHGLDFYLGDDNKVLDSVLEDTQIHFGYSDSNTVKNTTIFGGIIQLDNSNDDLIEDCRLTGSDVDPVANIQVVGENNMVKGCLVYDTGSDAIRMNGNNNIIIGNTLVNNEWGAISLYSSEGNLISNNTIKSSGGYGLQMIGSKNNTVRYNNFIDGDDYAIYMARSAWATRDNEIAFNNFMNNGGLDKQAYDYYYNLNTWNTATGGNYWSDHANNDLNDDKFADQAYFLDGEGGAKDRMPFASKLIFPNPPMILTKDVTTAYTDQNYSVGYNVFDWDTPASKLKWTFKTNASWLTFTSSWVLKGLPKVSTSSYWVNLSVSDGAQMDFTNFTLQVINNNIAPRITTANVPVCHEDQLYFVDYDADDTDDLVWSLMTDAAFLSLDADEGILSGRPANDDVGLYTVIITVMDEWSSDSSEFTLEVINTNDPPVITTEDVLSVKEGDTYRVQYAAFDMDPTSDALAWNLLTNCQFLSMDRNTGILTGTPGESDAGTYMVNVTVVDGKGGFDTHVFDLEVVRVNNAPSSIQANWIVYMDEDGTDSSLNAGSMFSDIDGDTLSFMITGGEHVSFEVSDGGVITLEPSPDWFGTEVLTISATDGEETTISTITVEVRNINDPPADAVIDKGSAEFREDGPQRVSASAFDADNGDALTYEWFVEGMGLVGVGEFIDLDLPAGTYTLTLRVTDRSGEFTETSMQIVVLPVSDIVPHVEPSPTGTSIAPYLLAASVLLLGGAIALSFFILRRRNQKQEDAGQGVKAWNQVFHFNDGPTPTKGKVPGPTATTSLHRLAAERDLAPNTGGEVNGGKLRGPEHTTAERGYRSLQEEEEYLSDLVEEALDPERERLSSADLLDRLEVAHTGGRIPRKDFAEIKRRLNNIDK